MSKYRIYESRPLGWRIEYDDTHIALCPTEQHAHQIVKAMETAGALRAYAAELLYHLQALADGVTSEGQEYCGVCDWMARWDTEYVVEVLDHRPTCPLHPDHPIGSTLLTDVARIKDQEAPHADH